MPISYEKLVLRQNDTDNGIQEAHINQTLLRQWIGGLIPLIETQGKPEWNLEQGFIQYLTELITGAETKTRPLDYYMFNAEYMFLKVLENQFDPSIMKSAVFDFFIPKL